MVKNIYEGLRADDGFELFERRSLAHVGIAKREQPAIAAALDELALGLDAVAESVGGDTNWRHLRGDVQDLAWQSSNPKGRMVLAVGGLARRGWRHPREQHPRDALFPTFRTHEGRLDSPGNVSTADNLALPLFAVNHELGLLEYIPGTMLDVCHATYQRETLPERRKQILKSMRKMHFRDKWDVGEDTHQIARIFRLRHDDDFLRKMNDLAISDAEQGDPVTFGYRASRVLNDTVKKYPEKFTDDEAARIVTMLRGEPLAASEYQRYMADQRRKRQLAEKSRETEEAERRERSSAIREETLDQMGELLSKEMRL